MNVGLVFPGQGSQYVGMGEDYYASSETVRAVFREAQAVTGMDVASLCFRGPRELLDLTLNTQVALLTLEVAIYHLLRERAALSPLVMAGHSLGEYAALYASGAVGFADVFSLVQARARYHQEAIAPGEGSMAAIVGATEAQVEGWCTQAAAAGTVSVAIINAPGQVVVSGRRQAVTVVMDLAKTAGVPMAVSLPISVPCHSPILLEGARRLMADLERVSFTEPRVPVIPNCDPRAFHRVDMVRSLLMKQMVATVQWQATAERIIALGVDTVLEIGPKRVLCNLFKRMKKKMQIIPLDNLSAFQQAVDNFLGTAQTGNPSPRSEEGIS